MRNVSNCCRYSQQNESNGNSDRIMFWTRRFVLPCRSLTSYIPMNRTIPTHIRRDNPATIDSVRQIIVGWRMVAVECWRKGLKYLDSLPTVLSLFDVRRKDDADGRGSHSQAIRIGNRAGYRGPKLGHVRFDCSVLKKSIVFFFFANTVRQSLFEGGGLFLDWIEGGDDGWKKGEQRMSLLADERR